jgi:hypothetical protein
LKIKQKVLNETKIIMEDIDRFIQNLKEEQEIKDYVEKDIYPERLRTSKIKKYNPLPLKPLEYDIIEKENIENNTSLIDNCFTRLCNVEKQLKDLERCNVCPICLKLLKNNFIQPSCGHKICISCGFENILKNKQTGNLCCLCRKSLID